MDFKDQYGPWALIAGASEGLGAAFADECASRGCNVVLIARRQELLDETATGIRERHGVETRTLRRPGPSWRRNQSGHPQRKRR